MRGPFGTTVNGPRFAFWGLTFLAGYAVVTTLSGGGAGSATPNRVFGDCVRLTGSGWAPTACDAPAPLGSDIPPEMAAPVDPDQVTTAGEFGGRAAGQPLTMDEVERLWVTHGGNPADAHTAAAVATAESGRRPDAVNASNSNGTVDRGLFQINSIHGACSTFDLTRNVQCAVDLHRSSGWRPWVAYQSGAYRRYL